MRITMCMDRELTEGERFAIDRFSYYYEQKRAFAVIGAGAVVVMGEPGTAEEMAETAQKAMEAVRNSHPDFTSYLMDDGNVLTEDERYVKSVLERRDWEETFSGITSGSPQYPIFCEEMTADTTPRGGFFDTQLRNTTASEKKQLINRKKRLKTE